MKRVTVLVLAAAAGALLAAILAAVSNLTPAATPLRGFHWYLFTPCFAFAAAALHGGAGLTKGGGVFTAALPLLPLCYAANRFQLPFLTVFFGPPVLAAAVCAAVCGEIVGRTRRNSGKKKK
ncbi:MAG: hypothetical protein ACOX8R_04285 [Bacillota bacterium]|jgi:hypothetical protein